jgi:hypothetical protein
MKWRVVDLKATLGELHQPKSGNKDVLVNRLLRAIAEVQPSRVQEQKIGVKEQEMAGAGMEKNEHACSVSSSIKEAEVKDNSSSTEVGRRPKPGEAVAVPSEDTLRRNSSNARALGLLQRSRKAPAVKEGAGPPPSEEPSSRSSAARENKEPVLSSSRRTNASTVNLLQRSRRPGVEGGTDTPLIDEQPSSSSSSSVGRLQESRGYEVLQPSEEQAQAKSIKGPNGMLLVDDSFLPPLPVRLWSWFRITNRSNL